MRNRYAIAVVAALASTPAFAGEMVLSPADEQDSVLGRILVDDRGMTLYTYAKDVRYRPSCLGECAETFLPFSAPEGICADGDWSIVYRSDRMSQWAYAGRPLYVHVADSKPGDMNGLGADEGAWRVAEMPCMASISDGETAHAEAEALVGEALEAGIEPVEALRRWCRLDTAELASMAGISVAALAAHENGARALDEKETAAVANALGVSFDLLLR